MFQLARLLLLMNIRPVLGSMRNTCILTLVIVITACGQDRKTYNITRNTETEEQESGRRLQEVDLAFTVFANDTLSGQKGTGGYGYDIFIDGQMYIHQPTIPAVNGSYGFPGYEVARTVAEFVIGKIRKNQIPPTISIDELKKLGVVVPSGDGSISN